MSNPPVPQLPVYIRKYDPGVPAENIERYIPGGYHPVFLNEYVKDGQYKIVHKLGFGGFSTVWLAKDVVNNRNVTVKVLRADQSDVSSCRELYILQHLQQTTSTLHHPGSRFVPTLFDFFYTDGPNGHHLCLVLDVVGPTVMSIHERSESYSGKLARRVSRQLLLAVDYLHESGVVHGDIHTCNILYHYPGLDTFSTEEIIKCLGNPRIGPTESLDGTPLPPNVPEQLVEPADYPKPRPVFSDIQLIDFGEAFLIGDAPETLNNPIYLQPPELIFRRPLTEAVDVWGLGCSIIEEAPCARLFWAKTNAGLLFDFQMVFADFPERWIAETLKQGIFTPNDMTDMKDAPFIPIEEAIRESKFHKLDDRDLESVTRCLQRMLVLDPNERATIKSLLDEDWFAEDEIIQCSEETQETKYDGQIAAKVLGDQEGTHAISMDENEVD